MPPCSSMRIIIEVPERGAPETTVTKSRGATASLLLGGRRRRLGPREPLLLQPVEDARHTHGARDRLVESERDVRRAPRAEDLGDGALHERCGVAQRVLGLAPASALAQR